ncbi:Hypothetical protein AA314_07018 [Archangium gephyra]|uniref:Uncharacterized protein n=1 Tax=Archangium gephyra TaxID=48 RepID=A0AAC8QCV1_9BACT|nr:Hypothetical protein AA314_07018 [Archangium gephyra]
MSWIHGAFLTEVPRCLEYRPPRTAIRIIYVGGCIPPCFAKAGIYGPRWIPLRPRDFMRWRMMGLCLIGIERMRMAGLRAGSIRTASVWDGCM